MSNFISDVIDGRALLSDFDDYVDEWHTDLNSEPNDLHQFLGMTWDEYRVFVEQPYSLRFIVAAHRTGLPLQEILQLQDGFALAARAADRMEADSLLKWLVERGRVQR